MNGLGWSKSEKNEAADFEVSSRNLSTLILNPTATIKFQVLDAIGLEKQAILKLLPIRWNAGEGSSG